MSNLATANDGKTLPELMTVLAIVALVVALSGESLPGASSRNTHMAVRAEIASELRMARHMALARGERVRVYFEPQGTLIRTELADEPRSTLRSYDLSRRGVVVEAPSNGPSVLFYPSGRAATPTTITLKSLRDGRLMKLTVSMNGLVNLK